MIDFDKAKCIFSKFKISASINTLKVSLRPLITRRTDVMLRVIQ